MNGLESIFWQLRDKKYKGINNTYALFQHFYISDGEKIKKWVSELFRKKPYPKCNSDSELFRKQGNGFYVKGKWRESLKYYMKALCVAENQTEAFATALANRSAALYSLGKYEHSLSDIEKCLLCGYPEKLKFKVYLRKINCYDRIGNAEKAEVTIKETEAFINQNNDYTTEEKESYINKLRNIQRLSSVNLVKNVNNNYKIPNVTRNINFPGATSLIQLSSNSEKGRYVLAEKDVKRGDILFVEKAYAFAPIFDDNLNLPHDRCYYCLIQNIALIPCLHCSSTLYCNESCRSKSWDETHQWECTGFTVNLWGTIGLAFPAYRLCLKNILNCYRLEAENYNLAQKLLTNIAKNENVLEFLVLTMVLVCYFESQTDFFKWLCDKITLEEKKELNIYFGSCLLENVAQIACNASIIEHWNCSDFNDYNSIIPEEKMPIATGLYPAVSMMNHSCKPNVAMYFINDVIIVKAVADIKQGKEVYNCYGIDYRYTTKQERQSLLYMQYHFKCLCEICENPLLEIDYLNTFRCPLCSGAVLEDSKTCYDCTKLLDVSKLWALKREAKYYLEKEIVCLEDIEKSYKITKSIYNPYHKEFAECYDKYKTYYFHIGDFDKSLEYFLKFLEIEKKHWGEHSIKLALNILGFLDDLKSHQNKNVTEAYKGKVKQLSNNVKEILPLHYPDEIVNYDEIYTAE